MEDTSKIRKQLPSISKGSSTLEKNFLGEKSGRASLKLLSSLELSVGLGMTVRGCAWNLKRTYDKNDNDVNQCRLLHRRWSSGFVPFKDFVICALATRRDFDNNAVLPSLPKSSSTLNKISL